MKPLRMLCDAEAAGDRTPTPLVLLSLCTVTKRIQPAGRSFLETFETPAVSKHHRKKTTREKDLAASPPPQEEEFSTDRAEAWKTKNKNKTPGGGGGGSSSSLASGSHLKRILSYDQTLYRILGVDEGASLDEIKKQYRKKVLEYHPDKAKTASNSPLASPPPSSSPSSAGDSPQSCEHEAFLRVQEAYEALSDSNFRRQYDSSLPFDESIPSPNECHQQPEKFYEIFGAAFNRNARWSIRRPVPSLGDEKTPLAVVERFYDFWYDFQSWRDFGVHDEYDLNEAECREERRWMERENAKIRKKYLKNERARIQRLVETAYAADPRIQRQKEEERKKREEEKAAKQRAYEAQMREAEERKKREAEEERRREEEAKNLQKQQQQEKQRLKKWRQKFRWLYRKISEDASPPAPLSVAQVQDLSAQLDMEVLLPFFQKIHDYLGVEGPIQDETGDPSGPMDFTMSDQQKEMIVGLYVKEWQALLDAKRAKELAAEEEMLRVQEEKKRQELARKKAQEAAWTIEELSMLAKGLQKFPGGTARRWHQIASFIGTKTQEEVVQKAKEMANGSSLKSMGSKISQPLEQTKAQQQGALTARTLNSGKTDAESARPTGSTTEALWTQEQQTALERALAKHPSSMPAAERWSAIASDVPGKTRKECIERFKQIRAAILASKGS
ncbi:dnaJ homolog subfamily C member 2 [Cyclospora cayetanensis]|uniref:DnaJ homolog subfamily C member 2 n=1 Tax=Cyclospora cayetanensis TaxID=88456 RepID=A0A6P6RS48_9EIME|nr:dnaJ homolog subfamily C member 2 [Cyclospora cayetanensis]